MGSCLCDPFTSLVGNVQGFDRFSLNKPALGMSLLIHAEPTSVRCGRCGRSFEISLTSFRFLKPGVETSGYENLKCREAGFVELVTVSYKYQWRRLPHPVNYTGFAMTPECLYLFPLHQLRHDAGDAVGVLDLVAEL